MSKHKKDKKKRKRRSPSSSSASSSSDGSSGGDWVEKSPPPRTQENPPKKENPPMTGPSFLDLALSSSSSREKKEKTKTTDRPEPIELPIGLYYPNRKQESASSSSSKQNDTSNQNHEYNSYRKDKYGKEDNNYNGNKYGKYEIKNNKQFQKPRSDHDDDYSSSRRDKYGKSDGQSSRQFQKPRSDDDDNDDSNTRRKYKCDGSEKQKSKQFQKPSSDFDDDYSSRRKDKYERTDRQSSKHFQKPSSGDEYDTHRNDKTDRQNNRRFQKPRSDSDDDYSSCRKDKYERYGRQSRKQFHKPRSDDDEDQTDSHRNDKYEKSDRQNNRRFQKPRSDSDDDYRKDKYERYDRQSRKQFQKPRSDDDDDEDETDSHRNAKYERSEKREDEKKYLDKKHEPNTGNKDQGSEKPNNVPVSHDDVNKIAAKLIKAEMMGNTDLVSKLKAKLEVAKLNETPIKRSGKQDTRNPKDEVREKDRVVVITEQSMKDRRRTELLERKKLSFLGDNEDRWVAEGKTFANIGDEYEEEADAPKRKKQKAATSNPNQSAGNAIQEHKKAAQILSSCAYCSGGDTKHAPILVDHYTEDVYLALPSTEPLTEHHCLIVTKEHLPGLRQTEPNVYNAVRSLCEKLVALFSRQDKTCVFFETVSNLKRNHCHVHCVPLDRDVGDDAPLYFQKSITDLETDTRHNRTLVKIARNALCRSVPAELEYFYVNFDWKEGFAHLIENRMSHTFAEEIIAGMLDLGSSRWRNPSHLSYEAQMKLKLDFLRLYNS
ncbi:hypothetical protein WDU94_012491 [Cyamophila willieti]